MLFSETPCDRASVKKIAEVFCTMGVFEIFAKFMEKHMYWDLFLVKLQPEYFHYSQDFNNVLP